ncbi:MAG: hypothetical protein H0X64_15930, partial [Gemmatimonadaceae bacterium]|nr:hypothetical protein [Gemmatimonadaceae bacterium]
MINTTTRRVAILMLGVYARMERFVERRALPKFASEAEGFVMQMPRSIVNPSRITIGRDVKLGSGSVLKCSTTYPGGGWLHHPDGKHVTQTFEPTLTLGDRVTATASLQVTVFDSVVIEEDVMFAANVFIADGTHAFVDADIPYKFQGMAEVAPVRIGRGSWLGTNVVVSPGVTIGEMV